MNHLGATHVAVIKEDLVFSGLTVASTGARTGVY
jgi:hypothetical protein